MNYSLHTALLEVDVCSLYPSLFGCHWFYFQGGVVGTEKVHLIHWPDAGLSEPLLIKCMTTSQCRGETPVQAPAGGTLDISLFQAYMFLETQSWRMSFHVFPKGQ